MVCRGREACWQGQLLPCLLHRERPLILGLLSVFPCRSSSQTAPCSPFRQCLVSCWFQRDRASNERPPEPEPSWAEVAQGWSEAASDPIRIVLRCGVSCYRPGAFEWLLRGNEVEHEELICDGFWHRLGQLLPLCPPMPPDLPRGGGLRKIADLAQATSGCPRWDSELPVIRVVRAE